MTAQEIKQQLNAARTSEQRYRLARDEANAYRQLLTGGKSVNYSSDGAKSEHHGNALKDAYIELAECDAIADKCLSELTVARSRVESMIGSITSLSEREVLKRRYMMFQRWEDIADAMNFSLRRIYQIHGTALQNIALYFTKSI